MINSPESASTINSIRRDNKKMYGVQFDELNQRLNIINLSNDLRTVWKIIPYENLYYLMDVDDMPVKKSIQPEALLDYLEKITN